MVKIIEQAVASATQGERVSEQAARIHLFADSAEGSRIQMNKEVATARTAKVLRRMLKSA